MRVLILDAHADAALACVQSLGRAGHEVHLAGSRPDVAAWRSKYPLSRHVYPDPQHGKSGFVRWLRELDAAEHFDFVLPVTDVTIHPLMELAPEDLRARLILPSREAFPLAFDKDQTMAMAQRLGVPIPAGVLVDSPDYQPAGDARYPIYLKPVTSKVWRGSEGRNLSPRQVHSAQEFRHELVRLLPYASVLVQEYVPGHGVGVEVLCDHGEIVMSFAHERVHEVPLTGGRSSYRRAVAVPPALLDAAARLMRELRWHGVAMVEFKLHGDQFWLMEINGRFWGSLPLAVYAGADFPRALIELLAEGRRPRPVSYRQDVYARNLLSDVGWFWANAAADKRDPLLLTRDTGRSLLELLRLFIGRECWDHFAWRDPGPGLWQLKRLVEDMAGKLGDTLRQRLALRRAPAISRRRVRRGAPRRLLVLCYGNIYRSAFASQYLRQHLPAEEGFEIVSAGFYPKSGRASPADFVELAAGYGVDLSQHRSVQVEPGLIDSADLILIMDRKNYLALGRFGRQALDKAVWLGALQEDGKVEVLDPYGRSLQQARTIVEQLRASCDALIGSLTPRQPDAPVKASQELG